jgi:nickel-type superoxide dismutase maturation protease
MWIARTAERQLRIVCRNSPNPGFPTRSDLDIDAADAPFRARPRRSRHASTLHRNQRPLERGDLEVVPIRILRRAGAAVLLAAITAVAVRRSFVDVAGPSMEPTLWPGDRLVTVPAHPRLLTVGQVVVLIDPDDPSHRIIKRITAMDEAGVEVHGDDPGRSTDSRRWGSVPPTDIRRIAVTRWPAVLSPLTRPSRASTSTT